MNCTRRVFFTTHINIAAAIGLYTQSDDWFQSHDLRNRWEGVYGENQGSPAWELRTFVASVEAYSMEVNNDLKIRYYVSDSAEAFVKAQVVNHNPAYLMQPKPSALKKYAGWREFAGWPTKSVLLPKRIASKDLGILIRIGEEDEGNNKFAPAIVYYSAAPKPIRSYRFDFFTAQALRSFSFEVIGQGGYKRTYSNRPGAGDRGYIVVEFDAVGIPEGWTRVLPSPIYEASGKPLNLEWKFYNKPLP